MRLIMGLGIWQAGYSQAEGLVIDRTVVRGRAGVLSWAPALCGRGERRGESEDLRGGFGGDAGGVFGSAGARCRGPHARGRGLLAMERRWPAGRLGLARTRLLARE